MASFDRAERTIGDILKLRAEKGSVAAFEAIAEAAEEISLSIRQQARELPRHSKERIEILNEADAWWSLAVLADDPFGDGDPEEND